MLFCAVGGESKEDFLASLVHGSSISCGGKLPLLALSPLQELHRAMNDTRFLSSSSKLVGEKREEIDPCEQ